MIRVELSHELFSEKPWRVNIDLGAQGRTQHFRTKFFALLYARNECKRLHKETGQTVSLKIKSKNGRYQEERTYGLDPARTPG